MTKNLKPTPVATVQAVLHALSEPVRIAIFASLTGNEACNCSAFLKVDHKAIPKSTLSKHFKVLRDAGLITSEKRGVELINRTNCAAFPPELRTMIQGIISAYMAQQPSKP